MMRRYLLLVLIPLAMSLTGCMKAAIAAGEAIPPSREPSAIEKLQDENKRLKAQLDAVTEVNHRIAYDLEVTRIQLQKAEAGLLAKGVKPAETVPAFHEYMPDVIKLGMLTGPSSWTGGADYDGMAAYLLVKDSEGTTLKARGNVAFDLIDISGREQKVVMTWAVPAEVLGQSWESLPPGYRIRLPWNGPLPWGDDMVFRSTFTDTYGHVFTASIVFTLKHKSKAEEKLAPQEGGEVK
jgi:hypothetical protein